MTVVDGDVMPLTLTPWPDKMLFCGLMTGDVTLVDDRTTAEYGGVPPVPMNWNVLVGVQLTLAIAPGVTASGPGGGAGGLVPSSFVTVGYSPAGIVRPVASVITYVRLMKHEPLVVVVNEPPLRVTDRGRDRHGLRES